LKKLKFAIITAMVAAIMLIGFITIEVRIFEQVPAGPTGVEIFCFVPG
jgi:hypothetical protein